MNKTQFETISDTGKSLADFMQLPVSFLMLDTEGATRIINQEGIDVCGFKSQKAAIGHSLLSVSKTESAKELLANCEKVITTKQLHLFEECNIRKDGTTQQFLSIKSPLIDEAKNIIGVFGISIVLGKHSLAENISLLTQLGLMTQFKQQRTPNKIDQLALPPREQQCAALILRGYTAKMIANELGLSFRTIESYIANLKARLEINTRTDLIRLFTM